MTTPDSSFDSAAVMAPAFLPGAFLGRKGLVRNMVWRIQRGESLNLFAGPKLGKTSLLLHLAWHFNQGFLSPNDGEPVAEYFDLAAETDCARLQSRSSKAETIVLLDNCDRVKKGASFSQAEIQGIHGKGIVLAGGRAWKEFQSSGGDRPPVKSIPLSVFLEHEAKQILDQRLSLARKALLLRYGGTHPYLLNVLQATLVSAGPNVPLEIVLRLVKKSLVPFFECCLSQLRDPLEHQVLAYLIHMNKPVNPQEVAQAMGCSNIKLIANTLCYLGLIGRWMRDEEATLSVNSQLLNEWFRETMNF